MLDHSCEDRARITECLGDHRPIAVEFAYLGCQWGCKCTLLWRIQAQRCPAGHGVLVHAGGGLHGAAVNNGDFEQRKGMLALLILAGGLAPPVCVRTT